MRTLILLLTLAAASARAQSPLTAALTGRWTGILEYRDYSEPPSSTKRVQLPTWLTIVPAAQALNLQYTYDDGPSKIVQSTETLTLDTQKKTYTTQDAEHPPQSLTIAGLDQLKEGHGTLILTGPVTDNNKLADLRTTWTIRRNLLSWLEEVRPAGSADPFTFRHRYTFTRADPPTPQK